MTPRLTAIGLLIMLVMTACNKNEQPTSGGRAYEVLVTGSDRQAVDATTVLLRSIAAEALPQREPAFDVSSIVADELSQGTRYSRNLVIVSTDSVQLPQTRVVAGRDVFAHPQTVVSVMAPSYGRLMADLPRLRQQLIDELTRGEMNHAIQNLRQHHDDRASHLVDSLFGCRLWVPEDLRKAAMGQDFLWMTDDGPTSMQSICVYRVAFDSLLTPRPTLDARWMLDVHDSVMQHNLPAEPPGSHLELVRQTVTFRHQSGGASPPVVGARGLWQTVGTEMGGPFVSLWRQVGDSVLGVTAFVYAPGKQKRNLMRRLEASLYTLKIEH